jgi:hypothetical protein
VSEKQPEILIRITEAIIWYSFLFLLRELFLCGRAVVFVIGGLLERYFYTAVKVLHTLTMVLTDTGTNFPAVSMNSLLAADINNLMQVWK